MEQGGINANHLPGKILVLGPLKEEGWHRVGVELVLDKAWRLVLLALAAPDDPVVLGFHPDNGRGSRDKLRAIAAAPSSCLLMFLSVHYINSEDAANLEAAGKAEDHGLGVATDVGRRQTDPDFGGLAGGDV